MAYLNWGEELSVLIPSIDDQHKELIRMINDFYESFSMDTYKENILELVSGLRDYTVFHFTEEENIMETYGYPDLESHRKEHVLFIEKVNDYYERIKEGKQLLSIEVTNFLKDWLVNHIKGTDRKYSDFLVSKGVK